MGVRNGPDAGEIARMLNKRAATLGPQLIPDLRRSTGAMMECGSIDGGKGQSLKLHIDGPRMGQWRDYAMDGSRDGAGGDMLELVRMVRTGGDMVAAIKWAKAYLGIDQNIDAGALERRRIADRAEQAARERAHADEMARNRSRAQALFFGAVPIPGTPAQSYLTSRAIEPSALGNAPASLRYRPDVWCSVRSPGANRAKFPAMIAAIFGLDGQMLGVHRTYLDISQWCHATRSGVVTKAPLGKEAKRTFGLSLGGHIPVWKGCHRQTLRDIPDGTAIYLSEGIEDALSVACCDPSLRVIAGVSLSKLGHVALPPQMGPLVMVAQRDPVGSSAAQAFEDAIARHQSAGRTVKIMWPPDGYKDFNDFLMGKPMVSDAVA